MNGTIETLNNQSVPDLEKKYTSNYTILSFTEDIYLLYTKNASDNLPIIESRLEFKPCLNHTETSVEQGGHYILENVFQTS